MKKILKILNPTGAILSAFQNDEESFDEISERQKTPTGIFTQGCQPMHYKKCDSESVKIPAKLFTFPSAVRNDGMWVCESHHRAAFTLAEVLITLGIIGIVAAMTLPTVINRANERQWKIAYKKAYSSMSQAFLKMQANDDVLNMSHTEGHGAPNIGENFKRMSKYFNTVKTCFDKNADECWVCEEGQAGNSEGSGAPEWLGCKKSSYAFIDYSGIAWYLYSNVEWPVLVDVNGSKKPNRLGQDRFVMRFAANGSNANYIESPDKITPWSDFRYKTRWCPSGYCLYTTWLLE